MKFSRASAVVDGRDPCTWVSAVGSPPSSVVLGPRVADAGGTPPGLTDEPPRGVSSPLSFTSRSASGLASCPDPVDDALPANGAPEATGASHTQGGGFHGTEPGFTGHTCVLGTAGVVVTEGSDRQRTSGRGRLGVRMCGPNRHTELPDGRQECDRRAAQEEALRKSGMGRKTHIGPPQGMDRLFVYRQVGDETFAVSEYGFPTVGATLRRRGIVSASPKRIRHNVGCRT